MVTEDNFNDFVDYVYSKENDDGIDRYDGIIRYLTRLFRKDTPDVPYKKSITGKVICPACNAKTVDGTYCSYCGQRLRERNYIVVTEPLHFGNTSSSLEVK